MADKTVETVPTAINAIKEALKNSDTVKQEYFPKIKEIITAISNPKERQDTIDYINSLKWESEDARDDLLSEINTRKYSLESVEKGLTDKLSSAILKGFKASVEEDLKKTFGEDYEKLPEDVKNNLKIVLWHQVQSQFTISGIVSIGAKGAVKKVTDLFEGMKGFFSTDTDTSVATAPGKKEGFVKEFDDFKKAVSEISSGFITPLQTIFQTAKEKGISQDPKFLSVLASPKALSAIIETGSYKLQGIQINLTTQPIVLEVTEEVPNIAKEQGIFINKVIRESQNIGPTMKGYAKMGEKVREVAEKLGLTNIITDFISFIDTHIPFLGYFLKLIFGGGLTKMIAGLNFQGLNVNGPEKKSMENYASFLGTDIGKAIEPPKLTILNGFAGEKIEKFSPLLQFAQKKLKLTKEIQDKDFWPFLMTGKGADGKDAPESITKKPEIMALKKVFDEGLARGDEAGFLDTIAKLGNHPEIKAITDPLEKESANFTTLIQEKMKQATSFPIEVEYGATDPEPRKKIVLNVLKDPTGFTLSITKDGSERKFKVATIEQKLSGTDSFANLTSLSPTQAIITNIGFKEAGKLQIFTPGDTPANEKATLIEGQGHDAVIKTLVELISGGDESSLEIPEYNSPLGNGSLKVTIRQLPTA